MCPRRRCCTTRGIPLAATPLAIWRPTTTALTLFSQIATRSGGRHRYGGLFGGPWGRDRIWSCATLSSLVVRRRKDAGDGQSSRGRCCRTSRRDGHPTAAADVVRAQADVADRRAAVPDASAVADR